MVTPRADMPINKILVIADKPKHQPIAWLRALDLAQISGAELHVFGFAYVEVDALEAKERRRLKDVVLRERQKQLDALVASARAKGVRVQTHSIWSKDLSAWVSEHVARTRYDLVLKTANKRSTSRTPTDWQLLRDCPLPLLLVISRSWPRRRRVLATLDFRRQDAAHRKLNDRVINAAHAIGLLYSAEIHLIHVLEVSDILVGLDVIDVAAFEQQRRADLAPVVQALLDRYGIAPDRVHLPLGKVGHVVNATADRLKAGLIVMGTTSRRGVAGMVVGNSAEKVLTHTNTDILALKP